MKRIVFLLFLSVFTSFSQDFSQIKVKTNEYPGLLTAPKLANYIKKDFKKSEDQVKALYAWMTKNIRYDLEEFYNPARKTSTTFQYRTLEERAQKIKALEDKTVRETLRSKKAVCEGYARVFAKVCDLLGLENEVIEGYVRNSSRTIGKPRATPNHAWNAVKIDNKWLYVDTTWGAGAESNGRWVRRFNPYYFNIPKKKYFQTHLPEDSLWILRVGRTNKEKFYKQPIYSHEFLKSNVTLVGASGILTKNAQGNVQVVLQNAADKEILVGFLGSPMAQKPKVVQKGKQTIVTITPPANAKECFLLVDREVAIEFLLN